MPILRYKICWEQTSRVDWDIVVFTFIREVRVIWLIFFKYHNCYFQIRLALFESPWEVCSLFPKILPSLKLLWPSILILTPHTLWTILNNGQLFLREIKFGEQLTVLQSHDCGKGGWWGWVKWGWRLVFLRMCVCVCVCCRYIYIYYIHIHIYYIYIHTHTHTYIYIYIYII